ncbi:U11/U12 small nuclear ribonucleoprotein 25 kDa protein isoform X2 [Cucumis melo var. makuwa]|uniref:U11/U12 small nuclear ribonucleoprotein 25 kDa protein isoform X2 n=1 Tax=Cucumis melo var. makuwa TaxID=1194695 RepID=A0A5D3E0I5_CUCMM|nr:U11/U12 small nuclear ribonucleoprotein 25 kDa protein isoform X2 [Cucumis melo var. makuwa]
MPTSSPHSDRTKIANLWRFTRFIDYRCFAPPTLDFNPDSDALSRRPYRLLPRQDLIDLFVLKLDGSVFGDSYSIFFVFFISLLFLARRVRVSRNSTVADLKRAIEEVFDSPGGSEHYKITWSLIWGHFCLCYEGEKLTDDKACIRGYSIKDGDQLQFIRHMSINCLSMKKDRKNQTVPCKTILFKLILLIKVSRQNQKLLKRIKQTVETISRIIKFTGTIRTKRRLLLWLELDFSCQISSKDGYCIPGYGVSVRVHQKAGIGLPLLFALFEIGNGHGITQAATACKVMNLARNCRIET